MAVAVVRGSPVGKNTAVKFLVLLAGAWLAGMVRADELDQAMAMAASNEQGARRNITLGAMFQEEFKLGRTCRFRF